MKAVLFVDDNQMLSRLSCDILRTHGFRAVAACSAAEALEAFEKEQFDILVTDLRMPDVDGLQLARAIRDRNPRLPIIMVTAYGPVAADHINVCLPKEGLFPKLLEQIKTCLAEAEAELEQPAR